MKHIVKFFTAFVLCFAVYFIFAGSLALEELIAGGVVSLIGAIAILNFFDISVKILNPVRWFWMIIYIPFFLKEMIKANFHIAGIVLNPKLPIHPSVKRGRMKLVNAGARMLLANSITLTPGTLSVDMKNDELEIHCVDTAESAEQIMAPFEKHIRRIAD